MKPSIPKLLVAALFALFPTLAARDARAVHKNWIMKNGGSQCVFVTPNADFDFIDYGIWNNASFTRSLSCPVALSARWGSSQPNWAVPRGAGALAANVYVLNQQAGTAFSCTARARLGTGDALYFSRTASTTAGGDQKLSVAFSGDWGGSLETNELMTIRALDFVCSVPGGFSGVHGYKVRMCQTGGSLGPDCQGGGFADGEDILSTTIGGFEWVQTTGIECAPSEAGLSDVERGHFGIKNMGTTSNNVICPIVPSADDTTEHPRDLRNIRVYYRPQSAGEVPTCSLTWRDRNPSDFVNGSGQVHFNDNFRLPQIPFTGFLELTNVTVGMDVATAVSCSLPPGMTIQGVATELTVALVNGGG